MGKKCVCSAARQNRVQTRCRRVNKFCRVMLWITVSAVLTAAGAFLAGWYCNYAVSRSAQYCYHQADEVPSSETALLLGAAKVTPNGVPNLYFAGRIEAAAELFRSGKIKHIIISGDNSRKDYNEPADMKEALIARGVPDSALTLDYAGFRTLDSVVRAKKVFGCSRLLIITQPGHAERAVYIARKHSIEADAFYAPEPEQFPWLVKRNRKREKIACIAAWLDVNILRRSPKFEQ